ncbi:enolase 4 isoform X1 [Scleropages formosus]|uniref:enolase 4 isoform X1 n=1 Tax=Scleropages formosus TaxID=113540 RepID=UPI0008789519|nr:enolase 4 isoform X1 [Scleropages formosus]
MCGVIQKYRQHDHHLCGTRQNTRVAWARCPSASSRDCRVTVAWRSRARPAEDCALNKSNYFSQIATPPVVSRLLGRELYDGKGQLTVEAHVLCIIRNEEKNVCSAVISSHREPRDDSVGDLAINGNDRRNHSVQMALDWITEPLSMMLKGFEPADQAGVDKVLSDFFMARFLERQDRTRKEQEKEQEQATEPVRDPTPPPPAPANKKGGGKAGTGKKSNVAEKPLPSPEPPAIVVPGSMAIGSVSLVVAKAAALLKTVPLYEHIRSLGSHQSLKNVEMPIPMVTLLNCGKTSPGKLNLVEEVIVIPVAGQRVRQIVEMVLELQKEIAKILNATSKTGHAFNTTSDSGGLVMGCDRPEQVLDLITEACSNLRLELGNKICLAINCSAHELMDYPKGKYGIISGNPKSPDELVDIYEDLTSKYPAITALIDPFRKEDQEQWEKLNSVLRPTCSLYCDGTYAPTDPYSLERMPSPAWARGFVLKQTNQTTVTDLIRITQQLEGIVTILGTTSGEPCCDTLSDLAVGLGVNFVKLGGLNHGERLTKYNRLISIEEELSQRGILGSKEEPESSHPLAAAD